MHIVIGTRGSKLALVQANWVMNQLEVCNREHTFEIKVIKTKGDLIQNVALDKIGDKGVFVKEIEEQLLNHEIDLAIHSMKDMPSQVTPGLKFCYTTLREDPRDVLVLREKITELEELREGAIIGTGSKRRKYQLLKLRPDLHIVPIRGNIDTRIRKMYEEGMDGIVLAAAGLKRVDREESIGYYFDTTKLLPAPAQGALGLQIREGAKEIESLIAPIEHLQSQMCIEAERAFLKGVNGSCNIPIGAYAEIQDKTVTLRALLGDEEGQKLVQDEVTQNFCTLEDLRQIGEALAEKILKEFC